LALIFGCHTWLNAAIRFKVESDPLVEQMHEIFTAHPTLWERKITCGLPAGKPYADGYC